ncbi:hypothetical protein CMO89_00200 [Candidatus Woesearchaeota archaeon]|nr:hypothetical protein [Candidatus Woesearchaeota archaeon]|tara:strand:- start:6723 stop:7469 length:747 start_codon:yes stop_codon:yes gene_type:complete
MASDKKPSVRDDPFASIRFSDVQKDGVLDLKDGNEIIFCGSYDSTKELTPRSGELILGKKYLFRKARYSISYEKLMELYNVILNGPRPIPVDSDDFNQSVMMFLANNLLDLGEFSKDNMSFAYRSTRRSIENSIGRLVEVSVIESIGNYKGPLNEDIGLRIIERVKERVKTYLSVVLEKSKGSVNEPESIAKIVNLTLGGSVKVPDRRFSGPIKDSITDAIIFPEELDYPVPPNFSAGYELFGRPKRL